MYIYNDQTEKEHLIIIIMIIIAVVINWLFQNVAIHINTALRVDKEWRFDRVQTVTLHIYIYTLL